MGRASVMRVFVLAVLTVSASAIAISTFDPALTVSLVFPVSGVAVLWMATTTRQRLPPDLFALAFATMAGALAVEPAPRTAAMAAVVAVSHGLVWYIVMRRFVTGPIRLDTLRVVAIFMAACAAGAVVSAGLRGLGLGLLPPPAAADAALTALRNFSWSLGLGAVGLLLLPWRSTHSALRRRMTSAPESAWIVLEALGVLAVTGWVCWLMFGEPTLAVGFVLMLAVMWAALRTPAVTAVGFAFVLGALGLLATLERQGPFVSPGQNLLGAVMAQMFLVSLVLAALVIAVGTHERRVATERAQIAETEATERAALLAAVLEHLSEGVTVITEDDRYTVRNPAAVELTGHSGFLDPDPDDADQPLMVDESGEPLLSSEMPHARALASGVPVVRELVRVRSRRGGDRLLEITSSPVATGAGPRLVVNTLRDVTREHEERDQLVAFAGVVAHDLKNPLTVIQGWSESLQEELSDDGPPDLPVLRSMVERVQSASSQMTAFIDDLLGITVARDRPLARVPLDLTELAEEVAELRRSGASHPRIAVQPDMRVVGDRFLIRQLLDNLIGNAVKYVADGVRPSVRVTAIPGDGELEITVADNGVGIPVKSRTRVFDSFVRAHGASFSGTGLGLAICARVVERHGGRIWVAEPEGSGTRITFTLPRC